MGVHTVVFGGRPKGGEMQLVGGIKGSQVLRFDEIAGYVYLFLRDKVKEVPPPLPPFFFRPPI